MTSPIVSRIAPRMQDTAIHARRFVAATEAQQVDFERQTGRNLYRRGFPLSACSTDDMTAGWLAEERRGADLYHRCMMADASNDRPAPKFSQEF
jgi:hypothetical protein